jgi:hypothetical protein
MKTVLVLVLSLSIVSAGCSSASGGRVPVQMPTVSDTTTMAEYVQKLPAGSRVRVDRTDGHSIRGTLMRATAQSITVQAHSRVPEPPAEMPLNTVARVALENGNGTSTAKAVGIGIAAGVGTFFGILAIFAAAFND